jgi:endonuclease/exonuclease/phosphatase family metal-dependent hydrolase
VHHRTIRFVNTHLETQGIVPVVQQAQTAELLAELAAEELPVVLVGDFNSSPDDPFPAPYAQLAASGYTDTWLRRLGRPEDGATCCFTENLDDPTAMPTSRIDLTWARTGASAPPFELGVGPVRATVVGDELRDRTDGGLWPSDHAGVVTSMVLRFVR